jgi:hypothetical protein
MLGPIRRPRNPSNWRGRVRPVQDQDEAEADRHPGDYGDQAWLLIAIRQSPDPNRNPTETQLPRSRRRSEIRRVEAVRFEPMERLGHDPGPHRGAGAGRGEHSLVRTRPDSMLGHFGQLAQAPSPIALGTELSDDLDRLSDHFRHDLRRLLGRHRVGPELGERLARSVADRTHDPEDTPLMGMVRPTQMIVPYEKQSLLSDDPAVQGYSPSECTRTQSCLIRTTLVVAYRRELTVSIVVETCARPWTAHARLALAGSAKTVGAKHLWGGHGRMGISSGHVLIPEGLADVQVIRGRNDI